jgi:hypothetical protein
MQASRFLASIKVVLVIIPLGFSSQLYAAEQFSKQQLLAGAADICHDAAEKRYGEKSLQSIAKARWDSGLGGASVKIKVKPSGKKRQKYSCVVTADKSVFFHKS